MISPYTTLKLVTEQINVCGSEATSVSISIDNKLVTVTVAHFNCQGSTPEGHVPCEGLDLSLKYDECPSTDYALDFSQSVPLRDGDQVVAFGYYAGTNAMYSSSSWVGHVSSYVANIQQNQSCLSHYVGCGVGHSTYSYVVNADQMSGMSGSVVLNGNGIVGIAVATINSVTVASPTADSPSATAENESCVSGELNSTYIKELPSRQTIPRHRQTLVIDSTSAQKCLRQNSHLFMSASMCPHVQLISPPILIKF